MDVSIFGLLFLGSGIIAALFLVAVLVRRRR